MLQTAQAFLRTTIAQSYPGFAIDESGRRSLAYRGDADALAMVAPMPTQLGLGGLQIVRIAVAERDGKRDLVAGWTPLPPDGAFELDRDARQVVLARQVAELQFHYFGSATAKGPPSWAAQWDNPRALPKLVAMRVTFRDGTAWPDLLAQPMVDLGSMVTR